MKLQVFRTTCSTPLQRKLRGRGGTALCPRWTLEEVTPRKPGDDERTLRWGRIGRQAFSIVPRLSRSIYYHALDLHRHYSGREVVSGVFWSPILLYFVIAALFSMSFLRVPRHAAPRFWIFTGIAALLAAGIHFRPRIPAVTTAVRGLDARPPDPKDDIHKMFMNIMEEMHVVTGNRWKNPSAWSSRCSTNSRGCCRSQGEAVIGITEGLLSRLTRPQLESVVAHEAHHVLWDCLETTVASSRHVCRRCREAAACRHGGGPIFRPRLFWPGCCFS